MRETDINRNWTIFSSLHEALKEKELKMLKLAKCTECGRATPYRLKSLKITAVRCRRCGASISVRMRGSADDPLE